MRGINGDGRHQRLDTIQIEPLDGSAGFGLELTEAADANGFLRHGGQKLFAPAVVLIFDETVDVRRELGEHFTRGKAVRPSFAFSLFRLL